MSDPNNTLRMHVALTILRTWNNGTAGYDALIVATINNWIDGGMKGPIPWPESPFFAEWASERGYFNVGGHIGLKEDQMNGNELIAAERQRQIEVEGWTSEHDDEHEQFELTKAAMCYASRAALMGLCVWQDRIPNDWPETWSKTWWKPEPKPIKSQSPMIERVDAIRMLVKSGALIVAEIDRLLRVDTTLVDGPVCERCLEDREEETR